MQHHREFWSGRPVCIVGGTGFLGYHLARALRDLDADVRVFGLAPSVNHPLHREPGIDLHFGDVLNPTDVRAAVAGCSVVFNAAAVVSAGARNRNKFEAVHMEAVRQTFAAANSHARIVHTSSIAAIGATRRPELLSEDSPFPKEPVRIDYVHAKRAAETAALALAGQRDVVVVNPGYLLGPEDHDLSIMGRICQRFWLGRFPFAPPGGLNLADVRDVAIGHLLAAEHGQSGRRYILGGENRSYASFLELLATMAGWKRCSLMTAPAMALIALARVEELRCRRRNKKPFPSLHDARAASLFWYYRCDRAKTELGYEPRPLRQTIADTFAWHRDRTLRPMRGLARRWFQPAACGVGRNDIKLPACQLSR